MYTRKLSQMTDIAKVTGAVGLVPSLGVGVHVGGIANIHITCQTIDIILMRKIIIYEIFVGVRNLFLYYGKNYKIYWNGAIQFVASDNVRYYVI